MSLNFHAYQSELFRPASVRLLSASSTRQAAISGIFSGFLISYVAHALGRGGSARADFRVCMGIVALSIGLLGPRTRGQSLEALALDGVTTEVRGSADGLSGDAIFAVSTPTKIGVSHESLNQTSAIIGRENHARRAGGV